ncbi:hypothetical protein ACF9IK_36400 [Kitasatospora hibisci]|uniref:hypothetical protein n=1 Tax=Kitasatospora hibisci TaxID=3369522 RepID=UPI003754E209
MFNFKGGCKVQEIQPIGPGFAAHNGRATGAIRGRPPMRRPTGPGLCDTTAHAFTVTTLAALPLAYLLVFELSENTPGGDLAIALLVLAPLLLLPFALGARLWVANWRTALRWAGRAAARYAVYYLTPMALLASLLALAFTMTAGSAGLSVPTQILGASAIVAVLFGAPVVTALLMVAPWASRGLGARAALIVLANLTPTFLILLGGLPAVFVIAAHACFACQVIPAHPRTRRLPAPPAR